ncbi:MAG TPA: DNA polymerase III subunit gamma/tau [Burkholderiaceae bacterium]|nr:DNA polymerase III subunit gamma/tau [Burkholderiaceae bacterium]
MAHQVLARKWRPRDFSTLVGQDHVVRALSHALRTGRLHHAYLFTGTRGVGKTTIARILAKSLNCETGITDKPCGVCRSCTEIDGGRFPDYLEMDAASNRGVEEMAQLLEAAVYSPVSGRYKVYVIDEVHMLSTHAFNAMLKTLEEPPAHVVFILATTDPQKVPVTVLSRCLQFGLKNMPPVAVADHLARILAAEEVEFDSPALALIGKSAAGSMRDALSLLDQAIAFGGGSVRQEAVREMLGVVDAGWITRLMDALLAGDGPALVAAADDMAAAGAPFARVLDELAVWLQRVALSAAGAGGEDDAEWRPYAGRMAPEDLQVYYQIVIHGARDLALAPDEQVGFTMTLLRLLAFRPDGSATAAALPTAPARRAGTTPVAVPAATPAPAAGRVPAGMSPAAPQASPVRPGVRPGAVASVVPPGRPMADASAPAYPAPRNAPAAPRSASPSPSPRAEPVADFTTAAGSEPPAQPSVAFDGDWPALASRVRLSGLAQQFLEQSELIHHEGLLFRVRVPIRPLADANTVGKVREGLGAYFGAPVRLNVEVGQIGGTTAAQAAQEQRGQRLADARQSLEKDPFVRSLIDDFGGRIVPDSIRPVDS